MMMDDAYHAVFPALVHVKHRFGCGHVCLTLVKPYDVASPTRKNDEVSVQENARQALKARYRLPQDVHRGPLRATGIDPLYSFLVQLES